MTTYTPSAIRLALAANLEEIGSDLTVSAYELNNPYPPVAFIRGPRVEYDTTFGTGDDVLYFTVVVLLGFTIEETAQEMLDEYLELGGARSIKTLIEADRHLDGACADLRVTEASGPRLYEVNSPQGASMPPVLGCEWIVQVIT